MPRLAPFGHAEPAGDVPLRKGFPTAAHHAGLASRTSESPRGRPCAPTGLPQYQVNELLGSADRLGLSAAILVSMSQWTPTSNYTAPAVNNLLDRIVAQIPQ